MCSTRECDVALNLYCTSICFGQDPTVNVFDQSLMRLQCIFGTTRRQKNDYTISNSEVDYQICHLIISYNDRKLFIHDCKLFTNNEFKII